MTSPRVYKERTWSRNSNDVPLRPRVWNICGVRWMVVAKRAGSVTVQPVDTQGSLTGKRITLNASEWRSAQRSGVEEHETA